MIYNNTRIEWFCTVDEGAFYCRCFIFDSKKSMYSVFSIFKAIRVTQIIFVKRFVQYLPQQDKHTWKLLSVSLVSIMLNKQVDRHKLSISFEPRTKINQFKNNLLSWQYVHCTLNPFFSQFLDKAITRVSTVFFVSPKNML